MAHVDIHDRYNYMTHVTTCDTCHHMTHAMTLDKCYHPHDTYRHMAHVTCYYITHVTTSHMLLHHTCHHRSSFLTVTWQQFCVKYLHHFALFLLCEDVISHIRTLWWCCGLAKKEKRERMLIVATYTHSTDTRANIINT